MINKEIWIATTNRGKLAEFETLLAPLKSSGWSIKSALDLGSYYPPKEDGLTFLDNARIKARSMKAVAPEGSWILADDSGLEVEGLGGLPGVHSARYAGPKASDLENRTKLLKIMGLKQLQSRKAQFVCRIVAFDPKGQEHAAEGVLVGSIAKREAGKYGFGYDSVFVPEGEEKTLAELGPATKNKLSHRGQAIRALLPLIESSAVQG